MSSLQLLKLTEHGRGLLSSRRRTLAVVSGALVAGGALAYARSGGRRRRPDGAGDGLVGRNGERPGQNGTDGRVAGTKRRKSTLKSLHFLAAILLKKIGPNGTRYLLGLMLTAVLRTAVGHRLAKVQGYLFKAAFLRRVPTFTRLIIENLTLCFLQSAVYQTSKYLTGSLNLRFKKILTDLVHADYFQVVFAGRRKLRQARRTNLQAAGQAGAAVEFHSHARQSKRRPAAEGGERAGAGGRTEEEAVEIELLACAASASSPPAAVLPWRRRRRSERRGVGDVPVEIELLACVSSASSPPAAVLPWRGRRSGRRLGLGKGLWGERTRAGSTARAHPLYEAVNRAVKKIYRDMDSHNLFGRSIQRFRIKIAEERHVTPKDVIFRFLTVISRARQPTPCPWARTTRASIAAHQGSDQVRQERSIRHDRFA